MKLLWKHLQNNRGAIMISKMLMIVISVCVSSIVLVMSTAAMQDGVGTWFNKQVEEWFQDGNGMYQIATEKKLPERNANGTFQDTFYYVYVPSKDQYMVLRNVESFTDGGTVNEYYVDYYTSDWKPTGVEGKVSGTRKTQVSVAEDGRSISLFLVGLPGVIFPDYTTGTFYAKDIE